MARSLDRPGPSTTLTSATSLPPTGTPIPNAPSSFSSTAESNQTSSLAATTEPPIPVKLVLASMFLTICLVHLVFFGRERMFSASLDEEMATPSKAWDDSIGGCSHAAEVEKDREESRPSADSWMFWV